MHVNNRKIKPAIALSAQGQACHVLAATCKPNPSLSAPQFLPGTLLASEAAFWTGLPTWLVRT
ncbi:MAG TPA: hypothetical protein VH682_23410, partial [Gemmataceae bacterium]